MELSDILHNLKIQELTPMQEAAKEAYQSAKDLYFFRPPVRVRHWLFSSAGTDLESGYTRCAGSCTSTFTRIGFADRNCVQVYGNSFQSYELLWRTPCHGRTPDNERRSSRCHYRYSGTYERPFEEREFQCRHCRHSGDR